MLIDFFSNNYPLIVLFCYLFYCYAELQLKNSGSINTEELNMNLYKIYKIRNKK